MIGTGLTPEGINQNYVIYDLMIEAAWRSTPANLTEWIEDYATRRYGLSDENAKRTWRIFQKTIYDYDGSNRIDGQYVIAKSPSFSLSPWSWYATSDLLEAWTSLLATSENLRSSSAYLYDLVDVTRQVLQVNANFFYDEILKAYNLDDAHSFDQVFLDIFPDLETILSTNEAFLLGRWLNSAKSSANDSDEEKQFEYNARNQITLWGPRGEIMDYATKQWSGIASNFFAPRWQLFLSYANETLVNGEPFDQSYISNKIFTEVEEPFTFDRTEFPNEPT
ncbi:NAGLU C domain containing protein, partial [Asbolus verrucosus]